MRLGTAEDEERHDIVFCYLIASAYIHSHT